MTIIEYESQFHELTSHAIFICLRTETTSSHTQSLVVVGRCFAEVSYHTHLIQEIHHEKERGNDKRSRYQGRFSGSHYSSWVRCSGSQGRYPLCQSYQDQGQSIRPIQETFLITDGGQSSFNNCLDQTNGQFLRGLSSIYSSYGGFSRLVKSFSFFTVYEAFLVCIVFGYFM